MLAALLHVGPDGGAHDWMVVVLAAPWSLLLYAAVEFARRMVARIRGEEKR